MPTLPHVLVAPVSEGGALVFTHTLDSGICVWMRGLTRTVDERPRRLRGVAAPLYGGTICDARPLRDFVADYVERADGATMPLAPGRIREVRPVTARTGADDPHNHRWFSYHVMSPLHTVGPWDGAAAELLLSRVRGPDYPHAGFFATGLPELPADAAPDALLAAVIDRERAEQLAEYLCAPAGPVLRPPDPAARRRR